MADIPFLTFVVNFSFFPVESISVPHALVREAGTAEGESVRHGDMNSCGRTPSSRAGQSNLPSFGLDSGLSRGRWSVMSLDASGHCEQVVAFLASEPIFNRPE
jgi:hypothetical protein